MNYIDGFIEAFPPCYDEEESIAEGVSTKQQALDTLYWIGCQFNVNDLGMKALCKLANVSWEDLTKHSGKSVAR